MCRSNPDSTGSTSLPWKFNFDTVRLYGTCTAQRAIWVPIQHNETQIRSQYTQANTKTPLKCQLNSTKLKSHGNYIVWKTITVSCDSYKNAINNK